MNLETVRRSVDWLQNSSLAFCDYRKTKIVESCNNARQILDDVEKKGINSSYVAYGTYTLLFVVFFSIFAGASFLFWLGFSLIGLSIPFGHIFAVLVVTELVDSIRQHYIGWREYNRQKVEVSTEVVAKTR